MSDACHDAICFSTLHRRPGGMLSEGLVTNSPLAHAHQSVSPFSKS